LFDHVLRCAFPPSVAFQDSLLHNLERDLRSIQTPSIVIMVIMKGFMDWLNPTQHHSRSPTYGSLFGPDILLTSAYYEQFYKLSWFQLCLGRISITWSRAVQSYHGSTIPMFDANRWAAKLIFCLWQFTRQLWTFRNQLVHGSTVEETVSAQINLLHGKVAYHYNQYQENTAYVLPCYEYLFTQRSLEDRLKLSHDSITCWLRSVSEAHQILAFQQRHLQETAASFFNLLHPSRSTLNTTSDSDSSYTPSNTQSISSTFSRTDSTQSLTDLDTSSSSEEFSIDISSSTSDTSTVVLNQVLNHTSDSSINPLSSSSYVPLSTSPLSSYSQTGS
jgi:hypothetical protein